ncbi:MAG: hypothetical protein ABJH05_18655 [Fulvivirga sp.]
MRIKLLVGLFTIGVTFLAQSQVKQTERYEMEKKNTDDFFTVLSAGEKGAVIVRDVNKEFSFKTKSKGDAWEITAVDTTLQEVWQKEINVDYGHVFKAFEITDDDLYLLFRDGEFEKNDYRLVTINIASGDTSSYVIENELALDLSHITVLNKKLMVLAGYVRYSPTLVSHTIGSKKFEVIPGFFKDRSDVIDLRSNENGTFNVLTLEKGYEGFFIRLRTHGYDGAILFEREVRMQEQYRVLSGRSTGFIDGNIIITGAYGGRNSYYSQGIYLAIAKPEGQDNIVKYIDFTEMEHFFDYMRPKRAERLRNKVKRKREMGKDYNYNARLLLHEVLKTKEGFVVSAEVYDPRYDRMGRPEFDNNYFSPNNNNNQNFSGANYNYVRQPNRLANVDQANHFEYLESIVLSLNTKGDLLWDQSFTIDDVETASLEPVVDLTLDQEHLLMLYKNEEEVSYKYIQPQDTAWQEKVPILLTHENDEIKHNYDLIGGTEHWYGRNFFVWGYHKVGNNVNPAIDKRRNVLFINKVKFE